MTKQQMIDKIEKTIEEKKMSRIYFNRDRSPIYGKFVKMDDHLHKGFIRFVPGGAYNAFVETGKKEFTLLFLVESIKDIVNFGEE